MTGGGPVQEPKQSAWSMGAGQNNNSNRNHNGRRTNWRHQQLNSQQHSSESAQWISHLPANDMTPTGTKTTTDYHNMTAACDEEILPTHNTLITLISTSRKQPHQQQPTINHHQQQQQQQQQQQHLLNNKLDRAEYRPVMTKTNNDNYCDFDPHTIAAKTTTTTTILTPTTKRNESHHSNGKKNHFYDEDEFDQDEVGADSDDDEALSVVASAEEYAAKIFKLQQACLTPLKEDLADWLNKIMKLSSITSENFMQKLDNGVIICRLAKIISMWCEQQFSNQQQQQQLVVVDSQASSGDLSQCPAISESNHYSQPSSGKIATTTYNSNAQNNYPQKLSTSITNVHSQLNKNNPTRDIEPYDHSRESTTTSNTPTPIFRPQPRARVFTSHDNGQLRPTSLSTNCIPSLSSSNSLSYLSSNNPFLDNLIKMIQTKIWEDAKCRTFYARDNVSNFLRWTRGFGVNQSVLFESDDLVLHANTRQVVLCLLDVARIACVKHGFTEAPGLVKFEQEIDRELAAEREATENATGGRSSSAGPEYELRNKQVAQSDEQLAGRRKPNRKLSSRDESATDELILRYCMHKEKEAARKKAEAEAEAEAAAAAATATAEILKEEEFESSHEDAVAAAADMFDPDSSYLGSPDDKDSGTSTTKSPVGDLVQPSKSNNHLGYDYRVDSLDSGEGRTESASTSHSRTPVNSNNLSQSKSQSAIPVPIKQQQQLQRSESTSSLSRHSSIATSEISSSRSSLLSNQDSGTASNNKRRLASSDLDGKVMRIAKSYYGKGAKRGVTRLSEGKYRIADRIVFVRLLKGHRVMVRIGGGWDTLENFLFRHKSDPSQVIDVDNLLPIETKMTFDKSHPTTPAGGMSRQHSKLPYYHQRRSSSASSTNLSTSVDLSVISPTISSMGGGGGGITAAASTISTGHAICTPVRRTNPLNRQESMPESSSVPAARYQHQSPYLFIHRGNQPNSQRSKHPVTPHRANSVQTSSSIIIGSQSHKNVPFRKLSGAHIGNRPLGNSRTPTASSTNLYPATLTTSRAAHSASATRPIDHHNSRRKFMNGSTSNLLYGGSSGGGGSGSSSNQFDRSEQRKEAFRKLGRSSDSLQVSHLRAPRNYGNSSTTTKNNGSQLRDNIGAPKSATPKT